MGNKKIAYLYLLITFCAWGSLYVVSKFVLGKVPVLTILFLRFFLAGIVLLFIVKHRKLKKIERKDYKYIILIGFAGYFVSTGAQLLGTKLSNASLASLINSLNPVAITVFAAFLLKEKFTLKKGIGIILAIIGVYSIVGGDNSVGQFWGIIVSIFSVLTWALVSVIVRRITSKYDALQVTTYAIFIAAICNLPFSMIELIFTPNVQFDWKVLLSLLYMGLVCTALAYVLWNKSLSMLEAGTCSMFYPLQPIVSVLLGSIFLGERINMSFVIGTVCILAGILLSIMNKKAINQHQPSNYLLSRKAN